MTNNPAHWDVRTWQGDHGWMISVPELGIVSQSEDRDGVEFMARDLIASHLDLPIEAIQVTVGPRRSFVTWEEVKEKRRAQGC